MSLAGESDYEAIHIPSSSHVDWYLVGFWIYTEISGILLRISSNTKGFLSFLLSTGEEIRLHLLFLQASALKVAYIFKVFGPQSCLMVA